MKYCSRPFSYIYLDHFNGDVYLCPWMQPGKCKIGNILQQSLEETWYGEIAERYRSEFRANDFSHCRSQACPHLQNNDLPDITDEKEYKRLTKTQPMPTKINLAYDYVCNQSCETCRPSVFIPPQGYKERMEVIKNRIAPYLDTAEHISTSGHGDPFASPYMMDILENMRPTNKSLSLLIETNGVFLDEEHWERIKHLSEFNLTLILTSNSYDEFTYKHISRGGNFKKLMHNLEFIKTLREQEYLKSYVSSFVIQDRNFREVPSFIERSLNEFGFDRVALKPVYQWGTMRADVFWFKDVLNPKHPYHEEYLEIMQHPALKDKRVYNFAGDTVHPSEDYPVPPAIDAQKLEELKKLTQDLKNRIGQR